MKKNPPTKTQAKAQPAKPIWDWRDTSKYTPKSIDAVSPELWAWEFLRRIPVYQREFEQLHDDADEETKRKLGAKWGLLHGAVDPFDHKSFVPILWFDEQAGRFVPLLALSGSVRVRILAPQQHPVPWTPHPVTWTPTHPDQVAVVFDLRHPITPQIELAKAYLQAMQKRKRKGKGIEPQAKAGGRLRAEIYPRYLLLLDAEAAGATMREVMRELGAWFDLDPKHEENNLRKLYRWLNEAKKRRDRHREIARYEVDD